MQLEELEGRFWRHDSSSAGRGRFGRLFETQKQTLLVGHGWAGLQRSWAATAHAQAWEGRSSRPGLLRSSSCADLAPVAPMVKGCVGWLETWGAQRPRATRQSARTRQEQSLMFEEGGDVSSLEPRAWLQAIFEEPQARALGRHVNTSTW